MKHQGPSRANPLANRAKRATFSAWKITILGLAMAALGGVALIHWSGAGTSGSLVTGILLVTGGLGAGLIAQWVASQRRRTQPIRRGMPPTAPQVCPTCKDSFPPGKGFCPTDGNRLVPMPPTAVPRGRPGGVCPRCAQGFDPGVKKCPADGVSLIPAPVFQTVTPKSCGHAAGEKICPACGARARPPSRFCAEDGTELRPLH